jgi:hypothetical protein
MSLRDRLFQGSDNQELRMAFERLLYHMGSQEAREYKGHGDPPWIVKRHSDNGYRFVSGGTDNPGIYYDRAKMAEVLARTPIKPWRKDD